MHCTPDALIAEESASPAPWCWRSWERPELLAIATTKGTKKPRMKKVVEYGTAERRVLAVMESHANEYGEVWLSVPHIARTADCCERMVQLARRKLCADGHLLDTGRRSGEKYKNTKVYVLRAPQISPNVEVDIEDKNIVLKSSSYVSKTSADTLFGEAEQEHEAEAHEEEGKEENKSIGFECISASAGVPSLTPKKPWPVGTFCRMGQWELAGPLLRENIERMLFGKDSVLVRRLNEERVKAGRPVPTDPRVRGVEGRQLRCLVKRFGYEKVLNAIIPAVVGNWKAFLHYWVYEKNRAWKFDPDNPEKDIRKAPLPEEPHIGFLLIHWKIVKTFCEWFQWVTQTPDHELAPDCKEHLWTQLSECEFETGPLPANIPAPYRKGKHWNSPVWDDHPKGLIAKFKWDMLLVPGTWNAKTEAKALVKLVNKGVSKDCAQAVLSYLKPSKPSPDPCPWDAFRWLVLKTQKNSVGIENLVGIDKHPYLVVDFWDVAEAFYADRAEYEALGYWDYVKAIFTQAKKYGYKPLPSPHATNPIFTPAPAKSQTAKPKYFQDKEKLWDQAQTAAYAKQTEKSFM